MMPLYVRHFTDLHLHPHRYGATLDGYGRNTRLAAGGGALDRALTDPFPLPPALDPSAKLNSQVSPDLILFGGDLFEQHGLLPTCAVVELLNNAAAVPEAQTRVAINGNHDGSEGGRHGERSVSAIALLSVLGFQGEYDPGQAGIDGARLLTIPYRSRQEDLDEDLVNAYQAMLDAAPCGPLIILGHNGLVGPDEQGIPGEAVYRVADLLKIFQLDPTNGLLFLGGHWHWPQAWVGEPPQKSQGMVPGVWGNAGRFACVQTGSTVPLTWADRGSPRGYLNAAWSERGWDLQFVELEAPRFIDLDETPDAPVRGCDFVRGSRSKVSKIEDAASVEVVEQEEAGPAKDRADLRLDDAIETTVGKYVAHQQVEPEPASRLSRLGLELLQAATKPVRG